MLNIRNFIISLVVSLIGFSLIAWLIYENALPEDDDNTVAASSKNELTNLNYYDEKTVTDTENIVNKTVNGLLCFMDEATGRADSIVLLSVNGPTVIQGQSNVTLCTIPTYLKIDIGTAAQSYEVYLGDLLAKKEDDEENNNRFTSFKKRVEAVTGVDIEYYAYLSSDSFVKVMDILTGKDFNIDVDYLIEEDMFYKDSETGKVLVDIKAAKDKNGNPQNISLDSKQALQLLRYKGYSDTDFTKDDGDKKRRATQADFAGMIMKSVFTDDVKNTYNGDSSEAKNAFMKKIMLIFNSVEYTNFDELAFEKYSDVICNFSQYQIDVVDYPTDGDPVIDKLDNGEYIAYHSPEFEVAYEELGLTSD